MSVYQPEARARCGVWTGEKRGARNGLDPRGPRPAFSENRVGSGGLSFRELNCWGMERFSHISWGGPGVAFRSFTRGLRISVLFHADLPTASNLF